MSITREDVYRYELMHSLDENGRIARNEVGRRFEEYVHKKTGGVRQYTFSKRVEAKSGKSRCKWVAIDIMRQLQNGAYEAIECKTLDTCLDGWNQLAKTMVIKATSQLRKQRDFYQDDMIINQRLIIGVNNCDNEVKEWLTEQWNHYARYVLPYSSCEIWEIDFEEDLL